MKKKTLLVLCLALALTLSLSVPAFAAGVDVVNAELERLMAQYAGNAQFEKLVDEAQIWLADPVNAATITDDVATSIVAEVKTAQTTAGDAKKLSDLSKAQTDSIIANVTAAANVAGLKFEASADATTFVVKDASGNEIVRAAAATKPVKQTDTPDTVNVNGLIAAGMILAVLMVFSVISRLPRRARSAA